jgi:hypothetical protein
MSAPEPLPTGLMTEQWIKDKSVSDELKDQWIRNVDISWCLFDSDQIGARF